MGRLWPRIEFIKLGKFMTGVRLGLVDQLFAGNNMERFALPSPSGY